MAEKILTKRKYEETWKPIHEHEAFYTQLESSSLLTERKVQLSSYEDFYSFMLEL